MEEIVRTNRRRHAQPDATPPCDAGVERVVYTSSVATIKPPDDGVTPSDETRPLTPETAIGAYKRSKVAGRAAWSTRWWPATACRR